MKACPRITTLAVRWALGPPTARSAHRRVHPDNKRYPSGHAANSAARSSGSPHHRPLFGPPLRLLLGGGWRVGWVDRQPDPASGWPADGWRMDGVGCFHGPVGTWENPCLLYTSPSPRDGLLSRMPSS